VLLFLVPVALLLAGAFVYLNSGRYVETDNAYVKAGSVIVSAEVAGQIVRVAVRENEQVDAGDVLLEIDDRAYRVGVEQAEAQLDTVRAYIEGLGASYRKTLEELKLARTNISYAEREYERERSLAERQLGTDADVDRARHALDIANQQIPIIEQALEQLRIQLGGSVGPGLDRHSAYRAIRSMYDDAKLDLEHTVVKAPFDGVVSHVPPPGHYAAVGSPVMSLVADRDAWIEANFKETQLTHVESGQPVLIHVDTYPGREWQGRIRSISPATGAEFSVIPAQNASGNWVKVAQRIPIRIDIDERPGDPLLRAGMSAIVEIDTGYERSAPRLLGFLQRDR
jgi:membrane fusion protein (multidrug efflux system)